MTTQDPKDQKDPIANDALEQMVEIGEDDTDTIGTDVPVDLDEQILQLRTSLARSQADYANLLMRVERDKADMAFFLSAKMLTPLLTQIDNLERAVALKA
jgi:molecular chaperone GrpE (heat shock protein)